VSVVELDVPNVTPALVSHIQSLSCAETVTVENATHIKVRASGDDACGSIVDAVRSRDGKIRSVHNVEPTLEDVFLYLTGHEVREQVADKVTTSARASHVPRVQNRVR
jgi:ABC-2 type transport system ATP-binding protein